MTLYCCILLRGHLVGVCTFVAIVDFNCGIIGCVKSFLNQLFIFTFGQI